MMERQRLPKEVEAMAADISAALRQQQIDSPQFTKFFATQVYMRSLSEAAIFKVLEDNRVRLLLTANFDTSDLAEISTLISVASSGDHNAVTLSTKNRHGALIRLNGSDNTFLYAGYKKP